MRSSLRYAKQLTQNLLDVHPFTKGMAYIVVFAIITMYAIQTFDDIGSGWGKQGSEDLPAKMLANRNRSTVATRWSTPPGCNITYVAEGKLARWAVGQAGPRGNCPVASLGNCTSGVTKDQALSCLQGRHLVFIGDSLTRYQYLNLVFFLTTGEKVSPVAPSNENERQWRDWNHFYDGTNARLQGREICDCHRWDRKVPPIPIFENRYWKGPSASKTRVTYIQMFGDKGVWGHNTTMLGMPCFEHVLEQNGNYSTCKQKYCMPGACNGDFHWKFGAMEGIHHLTETLRPDIMVVNSHHHTSWDTENRSAELVAALRASRSVSPNTQFFWKTGTPTKQQLFGRDGHRIDSTIAAAVKRADFRIFEAARILSTIPWNRKWGTFWDDKHFCPAIYYTLNQALLMQLCES